MGAVVTLDMMRPTNYQTAPWPCELDVLVSHLTYKEGWAFQLKPLQRGQGSDGLTLEITITTPDSYHPERKRTVLHYMPVPPASYDIRSWQRWLFDMVLLVEKHECMEFFQVSEHRPYAPSHGPGNDPYMVREVGTDTDAKTSFRGVLNP